MSAILSAKPATPPPPPPCNSLIAGRYSCTCRCCFDNTCPNYFEGSFPAQVYSNVGDPGVCNEWVCRRYFGEAFSESGGLSACPGQGMGGEVYPGSLLNSYCPPSPPPMPPMAPALCAAGTLTRGCECSCCTNEDCSITSTQQLPILEGTDSSSSCSPTRCAAELPGCAMQSNDAQPRVIARLTELSPCDPASPMVPPAPPPSPDSPLAAKADTALPLWVTVTIPLLAILLLAFCAFVVFIRHRERKGKPVWTTLEDTAGASVVPAPRQAMELTATAGRNVSRGAEP